MPPKSKLSKEDILLAAVSIVREQGIDNLNARGLAARLQCSTQPVFSNYEGMEQLKADVKKYAHSVYLNYLHQEITSGAYPAYKASGMGYIRFAKEEPEFFKMLFMCHRSEADAHSGEEELKPILKIIQQTTGLSYEMARLLHLEMWVFVHGVAAMLVTSYLNWDWEFISQMLTDVYQGLANRMQVRRE